MTCGGLAEQSEVAVAALHRCGPWAVHRAHRLRQVAGLRERLSEGQQSRSVSRSSSAGRAPAWIAVHVHAPPPRILACLARRGIVEGDESCFRRPGP